MILVIDRGDRESTGDALQREEHGHSATESTKFEDGLDVRSIEEFLPESKVIPRLRHLDATKRRVEVGSDQAVRKRHPHTSNFIGDNSIRLSHRKNSLAALSRHEVNATVGTRRDNDLAPATKWLAKFLPKIVVSI